MERKKEKKRESLDSIVIPDLQPTKSDLRFGYMNVRADHVKWLSSCAALV